MENAKEKREDFDTYPQALAALAREIRRHEFDPDEYYIVLTPDRYTQTVESALFGGGGALDCEVLTLSRLARRIAPSDRLLSREGGVMLIARAAEKLKSELEYYGKAATYYDFARDVFDTLLQFRSSGVSLSSLVLTGGGATDAKLKDLQKLDAEYTRLKNGYADSADRLDKLADAVKNSELIKKSHVYAIGYEFGFAATAQSRTVFEAVKTGAKSFEQYSVTPSDEPRKSMTVFSAPDAASQYKEIAVRIKKYLDGGGSADDVFVICEEPRALSRILKEYGIAYYHDESTPLEATPPLVAVDHIYKLKTAVNSGRALDAKILVSLCKNPFSGVIADDAQRLQLFVTGKRFVKQEDIKRADEGSVRAYKRAVELVSRFTGGFGEAVKNVVEFAEFEKRYAELYGADTDGIVPMLELAELAERYGTGDFDTDAKGFFSAAHAVEIKSLPRFKSRVTVTVPQTLRMTACKKLFVADFNEGVLPVATSDSGLIGDDELYVINNGVCKAQKVEPTVREQNRRERQELFAVVKNAEDVFCSYVTAGRKKPSAFMSELAENVEHESYMITRNTLLMSDDPEYIADHACTPAAAREIAARKASRHVPSISSAVGKSEFRAAPFASTVSLEKRASVSVSELSDWFACPYKRFLRDVAGVTRRRTKTLDAPDFGTVVHEFMRSFMSAPPYDCSREKITAEIKSILESKNIEPDENTFLRLADDAVAFAKINVHVAEVGKYKPDKFEEGFGGLTLGNAHKTEFKGYIDRIDKYGDKLRIMDYKTGATEFEIKNCVLGTDMQLPLYAYAAGKDNVTGFFYVKHGSKYGKDKPLHGRIVRDIKTVSEYDENLERGAASDIFSMKFKKDAETGELDFNNNYIAGSLPREQFDALIDYCVENASQAVDEMAGGYIERTPIEGECAFCPYRGLCGDGVVPRTTDVTTDLGCGDKDIEEGGDE